MSGGRDKRIFQDVRSREQLEKVLRSRVNRLKCSPGFGDAGDPRRLQRGRIQAAGPETGVLRRGQHTNCPRRIFRVQLLSK